MSTSTTTAPPPLIERQVTLRVSQDTAHLWDLMTAHLGLETFDQTIQMLSVFGAFFVASADMGYLAGLDLNDLSPEAVQAVIVPWLRRRTGQTETEEEEGTRP